MFAVTVIFRLVPGRGDEFRSLAAENATTSLREEPGCRRFDVCTDSERPEEVFLFELYDGRAAFEAHLAAPHYRDFDARTARMVAEKRVGTYAEVKP